MKNLFKALSLFQQEVPVILKDTQAYGYKYADLPAIFETINPLMKKHGLGFMQLINGTSIKTIIFHVESCEQIESITDIPQGVQLKGMNDFQVLGSAITYIRRYALSSALGLVTDKDTDAAGEQLPKIEKINDDNRPWMSEQVLREVLDMIATGASKEAKKICDSLRMKKDYYEQIKTQIEKHK